MSDIAESDDDESPALAYYNQASEALGRGELQEAEELSRKAANLFEQEGSDDVSKAYNLLGKIAYTGGGLDAAERWHRKELECQKRTDDELGAASTYHLLSMVAKDRWEFEAAKKLLYRSLEITERLGDEHAASASYHQLGMIAYEEDALDVAEQWYQKSLAIDETNGEERGAAKTCHNMSAVANARGDLESAVRWLWKSIRIKEKLGDEHGVATSYYQLGYVHSYRATERWISKQGTDQDPIYNEVRDQANDLDGACVKDDFAAAEQWFLKSLKICEKLGDEFSMAIAYCGLSNVREGQGDAETALEWRRKALQIYERRDSANGVLQLGVYREQRDDVAEAESLYRSALAIAKRCANDEQEANCCMHLGSLSCKQGDYEASKKWYELALESNVKRGDMAQAVRCCTSLGNICLGKTDDQKRDFDSAREWFRKALEINEHATWRDRLNLHGRVWRYRCLNFLKK